MILEQRITVPETLNDIKLKDYLAYINIDSGASDFFRSMRAFSLFCGIEPKHFNNIAAADANEVIILLSKVLSETPNFQPTFTMNGINYGFEPNLDDMTMGLFVDVDNIKDYKNELPKLMSKLYRTIVFKDRKRYDIEPYNALRCSPKDFEDMPAGVALAALVFFWNIGKDCLSDIQNSLSNKIHHLKHLKGLQKNGDGILQSLILAQETLDEQMKYLNSDTMSAYYGLPINQMLIPLISK